MNIEDLPVIAAREFMGGTVVAFDPAGQTASIRFEPPLGMANPHGTVQGGFAAAMIDDVVSMATHFAGGERVFVTSSLNCYYLRPVPAGVALLVSCSLVKVGKRQAIFDAEVVVEGQSDVLVRATQVQQFIS